MHPLIRIVSFLVFAAFVATGHAAQLAFAALLVAAGYGVTARAQLKAAWPLLRRMRWLFLSLLVVYLWFTPGQPLLPAIASQPTLEGVLEGLQRISALALLALAASLLLQSMTREVLIAALYSLLSPLRWLRVQPERIAVRLTLTLEAVTEVQQLLAEQQLREHPANARRNPVARISAVSAGLFQAVIARAEGTPCTTLSITTGDRPPTVQWLIPVGLCGLLWWLG